MGMNMRNSLIVGLSIIVGFILHAVISSQSQITKSTLTGEIVLTGGGKLAPGDECGKGCRVELRDKYIIVDHFPPGAANKMKSVITWNNIKAINLKE